MGLTKEQWERWKRANPDKWKERSEKIANAHRGRSMDDAHKTAISESMKGRTLSDEHRKKISASMRSKSNNKQSMLSRIKLISIILIILLTFVYVFGSTNLGFFISPPPNFQFYSNITAGSDAQEITEHIVFNEYRPESCKDGVLVYDSSGFLIRFDAANEVYADDGCSEADVHFGNRVYKTSGEFAADYVYPTPKSGSVINSSSIQVKIATNKIASFALLEVNHSGNVTTSPMAGSMNTWIYDLTGLPDGDYIVKAYAEDLDKKLIETDVLYFAINTTLENSSVDYYPEEVRETETYSIFYIISPAGGQKLKKDIGLNVGEAAGKGESRESSVSSQRDSAMTYDKNIKLNLLDFDYPVFAETSYKAKFRGNFGGKHDLRFEHNNTYYEYDFDSVYYIKNNGKQKELKFSQMKNVGSNLNKLTYSNLGKGMRVEYDVNDNGLMENIILSDPAPFSSDNNGDVVIEGAFNIPENQRILVYGSDAFNTTVTYISNGTESNIDVFSSQDTSIKEGRGLVFSDPLRAVLENAPKNDVESLKYMTIRPLGSDSGRTFKKLTTGGDIDFIDENGNTLFYFPAPRARDANGSIALLKYEIDNSNGQLKLKVAIPSDWLSSPDTAYPVSIDPETQLFSYLYSSESNLFPGKKNVWRDNNGKWYVIHANYSAPNNELFLSTNNTASGSFGDAKLTGSSGLITTENYGGSPVMWMDKFNNTLHVVFYANHSFSGTYKYAIEHSQCYINSTTSYNTSSCWVNTTGQQGYDIVAGSATNNSVDPDIAIDRDNNMYIVYRIESATASNYSMQVRKYNATSGWQTPVSIFTYSSGTGGGAIWPTIDSASTGTMHAFYIDTVGGAAASDNVAYHVKSINGGATWVKQDGTAGTDTLYNSPQCIAATVTTDDMIMTAALNGTNDIYYQAWNDTGTNIGASAAVDTNYNNCPQVGDAANGGGSVFYAQRGSSPATYDQMIMNKTKESTALMAGITTFKSYLGSNRSGSYNSVERHATIFSTSNNLGYAYEVWNAWNRLYLDTRTIYNSGTSINFGDQKYQVMPLKGMDADSIGADWQWATKHNILRDSKGYYYLLMLGDWNETYTTAGGSIYLSKSIEPFADSNGIVYFNTPKKIIGYNTSNATIQVGTATNKTLMTMVSGWIDVNDDHLHVAYSGFRNYSGGALPSGPYNNIYYSECTNLSNYDKLSSWRSWEDIMHNNFWAYGVAGSVGLNLYSYNFYPSIMGDYDGNVHVMYFNNTTSGNVLDVSNLAYGATDFTGGVLIDSGANFYSSSLDVDSNNKIYAFYTSGAYGRAKKSADLGATWTKLDGNAGYDVVGGNDGFAQSADISVTPDDRIFVFTRQGSATVVGYSWANASGTAWSGNSTISPGNPNPPSSGAGPSGQILFAYRARDGTNQNPVNYMNNTYGAPTTWGSAISLHVFDSSTYRGGESGPVEYKSLMSSDLWGYMVNKWYGYGGWYFGTVQTENGMNITRCINIESPGSYIIGSNLANTQVNYNYCMRVLVDDVIVDCQGKTIDGNDSTGCNYGILLKNITNVTIKNCIVTDYYNDGIQLNNTINVTILNVTSASSTAAGASSHGIYMFTNNNYTNVTNSNVSFNYYGILAGSGTTSCQNCTFYNNTAHNNTYTGISIEGGGYANLTNNRAYFNTGAGIVIQDSDDSFLSGNNASYNVPSTDGIITSGTVVRRMQAINNTVDYNGRFGFYMSTSRDSVFANNSAKGNPGSDFSIWAIDYNNTVTNLTMNGTSVSFTCGGPGGGPIRLSYISDPGSEPSATYKNVSKFVNVTTSVASPWLLLNMTYNSTTVSQRQLGENALTMYKKNTTAWYDASKFSNGGTQYGVNTASDYVWANITQFGSTFAIMGDDTKIYDCVDIIYPDTVYTLQNNLTGVKSGYDRCIYINTTNITLDCVGRANNITGTRTSSGHLNAIYLYNTTNATVKNCYITSYNSSCILVGGNTDPTYNNNTIIDNNTLLDSNFGIFTYNPINLTISNNNISVNLDDGINIYNDMRNITVVNNTIYKNTNYGIYFNGYLAIRYANSTIRNNTMLNNSVGLNIYDIKNMTVVNNTASNSSDAGFYAGYSSNLTVVNNSFNTNKYGIQLIAHVNNTTFTNNNASNNSVWDFISYPTGLRVYEDIITNLTMHNTTISFTWSGHGLLIKSTGDAMSPDPAGYQSMGHHLNVSDDMSTTWLYLNISYTDSDIATFTESTLKMWKNTSGGWTNKLNSSGPSPEVNGVDTTRHVVYANITNWSGVPVNNGVFVPMGTGPSGFSSFSVNDTDNNVSAKYSANVSDRDMLSGCRIEHNNSGAFVNTSYMALSGKNAWCNITITNNDTKDIVVQWSVFANDSAGEWTKSNLQNFTLTNTAPTHSTPYAGSHEETLNLAGYWRFDGNAYDDLLSNNGTVYSATVKDEGRLGKAYNFSGANQYIGMPSSVQYQPPYTVAIWVKPSRVTYTSPMSAISNGADFNANGFSIYINNTTSQWVCMIRNKTNGGTDSIAGNVSYAATTSWTHVVCSWDGTTNANGIKLYINGSLAAQGTAYMLPGHEGSGDPTNLLIGSSSLAMLYDFIGMIDEVALYRVALSGSEVLELYNRVSTPDNVYNDNDLGCSMNSSADRNNNSILPVYNWYKNDVSYSNLIMSFNNNVSSTAANIVRDYSPYQNNGTLGGGTAANAPTWNASGKIGGAYSFDGTNDYISISDSNSLDIQNTITISGWFYSKSIPVGYAAHIITKWSGTGDANYVLYYFGTTSGMDGQIAFYANGGGTWQRVSDLYTLPSNTWTHVAWAYTNTGGGILYINGLPLSTTGTGSGTLANNNVQVLIGGDAAPYFNGTLDEFRIYNRSLNAEEILEHYRENYDFVSQDQTSVGDNWICEVTPDDKWDSGTKKNSSTVNIESYGCRNLTTPYANYTIKNNLTGVQSGSLLHCMFINTTNITLDCGGQTRNITGLSDTDNYGIYANNTTNITIKNCYVLSYHSMGIILENTNFSNITNNTLTNNFIGGIYLTIGSNNITVYNNTANNNTQNGIYLYNANNNTVWNNVVKWNGVRGIYISGSVTNTLDNITNNTIHHNPLGILIETASNNTVTNNSIMNSSSYGMQLDGYGHYNIITGNNISDSDYYGIYLRLQSSDNVFTNNNITNSTLWDLYSEILCTNNTFINLTTNDTTSSFTYAGQIKLKSATAPAGPDPVRYTNISKYLNLTNVTYVTWVLLNISYNDTLVTERGLKEADLIMMKNNASGWSNASQFSNSGTQFGVDTTNNYVWANITNLGSIFALMDANSLPTVTQVVVDDYDSTDPRIDNITLNAASTRTVICNGTVTDTDGYVDVSTVNATFYDTAVAYNAADNNNTHYTNSSCYKYGGSGNTVKFNCTFNVYYYANSTSWRCNVTAYDSANQNATGTDDGYIDELAAVDSNTTYVGFGTVTVGQTSNEKNFTVINVGNVRLDLSLNGTNFNCPTKPDIAIGMLKYNCTTAGQNFDTQMANLTTTTTTTYCTAFDLVKKILTDNSNSTKDNYWKLFVPIGTVGAQNCNSTVRVAATKG